jgi:hypothetical protein
VADPVGAERPEAPAPRVVAAGQHQRERVHREGPRFTGSRREEDPARIVGRARLGRGVGDKGGPTAFEIRSEGGPCRVGCRRPSGTTAEPAIVAVVKAQEAPGQRPRVRVPEGRKREDFSLPRARPARGDRARGGDPADPEPSHETTVV